jgi:hypothetical protein
VHRAPCMQCNPLARNLMRDGAPGHSPHDEYRARLDSILERIAFILTKHVSPAPRSAQSAAGA